MVATRRGVRVVESPTKTNRDESSSASDSGTSSRRRTRTTAAPQVEPQPPSESKSEIQEAEAEVTSSNTQEEKPTEEESAPVVNQPDDIHDADVSDSESCCSVVSDVQGRSTRSTKRRGRQPKALASGAEGLSEAESCASAVSATPRRSTRTPKKKVPFGSDGVENSEAESCGSVTSLSKRGVLTRSQRKTAASQSASHTEDTELSEHDCANDDLRTSTLRKSTRGRRAKPVEPVPIDLVDSGDVSSMSLSRRTPGRRAKAVPSEISEGNESVPSTRRATRSRAKDPTLRGASDSESDFTGCSSMGSPRGTPCSSRTGSASSHVIVTRVTRSLRSDATHASSPLRSEAQAPSQGDAQMSDTLETEEKMEVDEHEATVIVTGEEGQASLLPEEGEEDKTLIAMEEEEEEEKEAKEDAVVRGVTVVDPAVLEPEENADVARPSVVVTESECPDTEMTEDISPAVEEPAEVRGVTVVDPAVLEPEENADIARPSVVVTESECPDTEMTEDISPAVEEPAEKELPKASVIVSEETGEDAQSDLGSVDTLKTTCADSVSATVSEVAEADTTEEADEGNDKLPTATDDQVCNEQTVKVTVELDSNTAEGKIVEEETVTELDVPCEQAVKVTICDASESKEERLDDASAHADSSIQDAAEDDEEPTGPDASSLKTVQVTVEEAQQDEEEQPMEVDASDHAEEVESLTQVSSTVDVEGSAAQEDDQQPSGSGSSQKHAAVSLLDSSDDEEEDDSDAGSLTGKPASWQEASENEDGDSSDEALTAITKHKFQAQTLSSDGLFVIDTQPGAHSSQAFYTEEKLEVEEVEGREGDKMKKAWGQVEDDEEFVDEEEDEEDEDSKILFTSRCTSSKELSSGIDPGLKMKELGGLYISFDGSKSKKVSSSQKSSKGHKHKLEELIKKSAIVPDLEKRYSIPPYKESLNATKLKRRMERQKTTGDGWFNMKAPELTEELKNDLKALQMRSAMDPKRFYKKNDREGFSKYVQVGTVVDSPLDFYSSRIPKKERKRTIVEELLADAEFRSYNKKKYQEIMSDRAAQKAGKRHRKKKFKSK